MPDLISGIISERSDFMLYIGCHLSASKGYAEMARQAEKIGANTFAFFTRNPRGSSVKAVNPADVAEFLKISKNFGKLVAHAPYTLNPCAADEKIRDFARSAMADDLRRMENIPNNYYNFHPGSHVKQGADIGIELIAKLLNDVLTPEQSTIVLLETMAGKGSEVGKSFEELRAIIDCIQLKNKIGVCLDTCHIWDGGYDIVNNPDGVFEEFDKIIGLDHLKAIHLNDSLNLCGSHKDRHAKIGEGHIGADALVKFINRPEVKGLPVILETPNDMDGYAREIKFLRENYSD
ncbi:MAG: deoxyribonuclease IV [Muribaculaceae bacterium]|nr:deoxyribonuclease IV [Alistipes senegalensis]MCM1472684.1 deoxyribonuclease IV [Muribaculaceae bacterium]